MIKFNCATKCDVLSKLFLLDLFSITRDSVFKMHIFIITSTYYCYCYNFYCHNYYFYNYYKYLQRKCHVILIDCLWSSCDSENHHFMCFIYPTMLMPLQTYFKGQESIMDVYSC